jgi:sugar phosphate isomerase/epimerase
MKRHPLSLHQLNIMDASPPELAGIAGKAGFDHVCLFTQGWPTPDVWFPLVTAGQGARDMKAALDDAGISAFNVEVFVISETTNVPDYRSALEVGASLGAKRCTSIITDPDLSRAADSFARFAELSESVGIRATIEFMMFSTVKTVADASRFVDSAGVPDHSLAADILHVVRTGSRVEDVAALDRKKVGAVQLCDGPLVIAEEDRFYEAMSGRMLPGTGEFPLRQFIQALPEGVGISLECPNEKLKAKLGDNQEFANALIRTAKSVLEPATTAA